MKINTFHFGKCLWTLLFCAQLPLSLSAQQPPIQRCGTMERFEEMKQEDPSIGKKWDELNAKINLLLQNKEVVNGIVVIPVVFHVIHDGDALATNENISDDLILAQIEQLNEDFRRTNTDAGSTPMEFAGVADDAEIEFCLARLDPNGDPTTGVERIDLATLPTVSLADCWTQGYIDTRIKTPTVWDATQYLNIWTLAKIDKFEMMMCQTNLLGYAQFPGMAAATDGVVLLFSSVGSIASPNPGGGVYNFGRTGTHEVGHYLNLIHIWGDANCGDDMVGDTPTHEDANFGCPAYPTVGASAGMPNEMTMNYMDYSDDACMNLFTQGQANRMNAAIAASRPDLLTAPCSDCPTAWNLTDAAPGTLFGKTEFTASEEITATNNVAAGAEVDYKAGDRVLLCPGFEAAFGSVFTAVNEDCTGMRPAGLREAAAAEGSPPAAPVRPAGLEVFPNPLTATTTARIHLPASGKASLEVLNLVGQRVAVLKKEAWMEKGTYSFLLRREELPAGICLVRLCMDGKAVAVQRLAVQ